MIDGREYDRQRWETLARNNGLRVEIDYTYDQQSRGTFYDYCGNKVFVLRNGCSPTVYSGHEKYPAILKQEQIESLECLKSLALAEIKALEDRIEYLDTITAKVNMANDVTKHIFPTKSCGNC